jgi:hypothetical protein
MGAAKYWTRQSVKNTFEMIGDSARVPREHSPNGDPGTS